MARKTWVQSQVKSYQRLKKWYLMPPCLTLSIIRYISRVKWSNPGKGVAPSHTPWCSSYWKGSLRFTLDYGRQLYFLLIVLCFSIISNLESRKFFKKSEWFSKKSLCNFTNFDTQLYHQNSKSKESKSNNLHFSKAFDSIHKEKMEQILLAYDLLLSKKPLALQLCFTKTWKQWLTWWRHQLFQHSH